MEFWNSLLTEKSWNIMQKLKKENFKFIVIGGWAAYLWTKQHKSRDIDIIIYNFEDLELLGKKYTLSKNDNLKKYQIKIDEIDVDIYMIYYSKLTLPIEFVIQNITKIEGFEVVKPEILLILKQGAELDRTDGVKGQKDRIDIMTLLCYANVNLKTYKKILEENNLIRYRQRIKQIVQTFRDLKHLNINVNDYSKIKKRLLKEV